MIVLLSLACSLAPESSDSSGGVKAPGAAVAFTEVIWGEASPVSEEASSVPCVTAFVQSLDTDEDWKAIHSSWLVHWDLPGVDWKSQTVLAAYIDVCTSGGHDLEMTDVWDTGDGALQVDLTFHRGVFGTAEMTRPFSIATVPKGAYVATANVTESHDDTGFGMR
jgi:hypothetical protein